MSSQVLRHLVRAILITSGIGISVPSFADSISCAGTKVEITFARSTRFPDTVEAVLIASAGARSTILRYDGNIDFIGAECRKTQQGGPLIVYQAYCGGSACKDLDNFGIIDPKDLRVLLVPNDSNRIVARQILGSEVAPITAPLSIDQAYERLYPK